MLPVLVGLGFLAVGTAVTVVAASQIWHNVHETREEAFEQEVDEVSHDVSDQIDDAAAILAGLDGLFASGEVGRAEFNNYVGKLESTPGFDAMRATSYIRLVTRNEVSRFEAEVRSDTSLRDSGYPDFAVHPDGENDDLFVVDYVEPLETETILGFDIGSNPSRRETVERARDTGELVATPGITLEGAGETGILLMQAIYDGDGVPVGTDERRERFVGVVTGVFAIDELLAAANQPPGIRFSLFDAGTIDDTVPASTVLLAAGSTAATQEGGLSSERTMQVADRRWTVAAVETQTRFGDPVLGVLPRLFFILGLATSAAIGLAGYALMNSRQKAAAQARRATAHLVAQSDELRLARDEALEADRLKTSFLANMSHELRTPLSAVIGLSGILANESMGSLNEKQLDYVSKISASGGHLLEFIDDLLDLARIEAGKEQLDPVDVDLYETLRESVDIVRSTAPDGMIELVEDPNQQPIIVRADARRLRQVVLNLLTNAVKFTPPEGQVGVEATSAAGGAEIVIWDTGIGIDPAELDRIFDPFHQTDSTLARQHGGSGLGLALSRRIVEMHGGRITVDSELGEGSAFHILWPLSTEPARTPPPVLRTQAAEDINLAGHSRTVVVAEDNGINLSMMTDLLETSGWQVVQAENGADAVRLTGAHNPDLVLMDIQMPVMDGLAATRLLKADPATASIPVLAVTALAMPNDQERCLEAGCQGYLAKPFTPQEFERAVLKALSHAEPARI
jgi:signal transduction histidine kinase/ActR/RegA family two-component response regulator